MLVLAIVVVGNLGDVFYDYREGASLAHVLMELSVAMLLLKGLSFKEIASVRSTMEKTVRQQASAIYRKAKVNGRHAFSAWFIEDLL